MPRLARVRITSRLLERLQAEAAASDAARGEWPDTTPGLTLCMRGGSLTWSVRYYGADGRRRFTIGHYPAVGLAAARKATAAALGRAAVGDDPQAAREKTREDIRQRRLAETVNDGIKSWLSDRRRGPMARWKGGLEGGTARSTMPNVRRFRERFGTRRIQELTPRELERFISEPEGVGTRNSRLTVVRTFMEWSRRMGLIAASPVADLSKERQPERHRVMRDEELRALILGFDATRWGGVIRLLTLTALRRDEVLALRWEWIDMDKGVLAIPPEAEKAGAVRGEPRLVALSNHAVDVLTRARAAAFAAGIRSPFVFPTSTGERPHRDALKPIVCRLRGRRSNGTLPSSDKRAKVRVAVLPDDCCIHDVRRTVADALLRRIGTEPWVVDHVVLGHVRPKLLRTYMPTLPLAQAREALQKWGDEVARILGEQVQRTGGES
jgi:integrase